MDDFLSWLAGEAPGPVVFLAGVVFVATVFSIVAVSLVALEHGHWIVPLVIWIILPSWFVAQSYIKSRKGEK